MDASKTTRRPTPISLTIWSIGVALVISAYFASQKTAAFRARPFTDMMVVAEVLIAIATRATMKVVPLWCMVPSRGNAVYKNVVYGLNIILGLLGILSGLYLLGIFGDARIHPVFSTIAICNLVLSVAIQGAVILVSKR